MGNIGVVRASDAGERAAVSAMQNADRLINMAFDGASKEAKRKGIQLAKSLDEANIRTINPTTGLPQALAEMPTSFGQIARDAYEATVEDRYRISIDREIKQKASELALQADQTDDPVGNYEETMGQYLDSMKENAQGTYFNYINEFGSAYLASTKLNLQEASIRRDRANSAVEITEHVRDNYPVIVNMITSGASEQDISVALGVMKGLVDRGERSRALTSAEAEKLFNVIDRARIEGSVTSMLAKVTSIEDGIKIRSALSSNGNTLKAVPKKYRESVQKILDDWNFANDAGSIDALIANDLQTRQSIRTEETRTLRESAAENYPELIEDLRNRSRKLYLSNSAYNLNPEDVGVAMSALNKDKDKNQKLAGKKIGEINQGDPDSVFQIGRQEIIRGFIGRLATDNPKREELIAIEQFFMSGGRDTQGVPEKYLPTMSALIKEGAYTTDDEQFLSARISRLEADEAYRVSEADKAKNESKAAVADVLELRWNLEKSGEISDFSVRAGNIDTGEELDALLNDKKEWANGIEADLADPNKNWLSAPEATGQVFKLDEQIAATWGNSLIEDGRAFTVLSGDQEISTPITSDMIHAVANAFESSDANLKGLPKELKPQVQSLINNLDKGALGRAASSIRTTANQLARDERAQQANVKLANAAMDINLGINGDTAEHRAVINAEVFARNQVPETFFRLSNSLQTTQGEDGTVFHPATAALYNLGNNKQRLPDTFLSDLESVANGKIVMNSTATAVLLTHYKALRYMKDPASNETNNVFASLKGSRLSPQAMASLDSMIAVLEVRGVVMDGQINEEVINSVVTKVGQTLSNEVEVKANNIKFIKFINDGKSETDQKLDVAKWLFDSVGGSRTAFRDLLPYTQHLIDLGDLEPKGIKKRIAQVYNDYYPETEGYVVDVSINDIRRSPNALKRRIPDAEKRQEFLNDIESQLPDGMTILQRGLPDQTDRGDDTLFGDDYFPVGSMTGSAMMVAEGMYSWLRGPYDADADRLFRETSTGEQKVYLVPQRYSGDGKVRYYVHALDDDMSLVPVIKDGKVMAFSYPKGRDDD